MHKKLIIAFVLASLLGYSQNQGANWFFEQNGGIVFDTCENTVEAVTTGTIITDQVGPNKGISTLSDKYGNLLFYSDSRTIWDANNQPLPNADINSGTGLFGHRNSIILPQPGSDNLFYIFVIDQPGPNNIDDDGYHSGLNYSIIDLNLRDGLGDVIPNQKNTELITYLDVVPSENEYKVSDLLTVVRGADCNSYWIITHFQANFYAFLFNENGVNPTPVISTLPPLIEIISFPSGANFYTGAEELKASPDGNTIAVAHRSFFVLPSGNLGIESDVYTYSFDKATGEMANPTKHIMGNDDDYAANGLEFSPSSRYLYVNTRKILGDNGNTTAVSNKLDLFRWDITSSTPTASTLVYESDPADFTYMQLGPDDKIYLVKRLGAFLADARRFLGVIPNPDSPVITVDTDAVIVDPSGNFENTATSRLPQINRQWFNTNIVLVPRGSPNDCELTLCNNDRRILSATEIDGATYLWYKDGVLLQNEDEYTLLIDDVGFYEVFVEPNDGSCPLEGFVTVNFSNETPSASDASIFQCDEDGVNDGITTFNLNVLSATIANNEANRSVAFYENLLDAQGEQNTISNTSNYENTSNPQTLIAVVTNLDSGCRAFAEVVLQVSVTNSNNTTLSGCDVDGNADGFGEFILSNANIDILNGLPVGLTVTFHENYNDALTKQNALPDNYTNTIAFNQTLFARVEDGFDCYGISEIELEIFDIPEIETEAEVVYCLNTFPEKIILTGGVINDIPNNYNYLWSTGETTIEIEVNEPGIYSVIVSNTDGCSAERIITVTASNTATIDNIFVVDASTNNSITVNVSGEGDYQFALANENGPYQDSNTFTNISPGFYTVYVRDKNGCGIVEETVSFIGFPKFFTPNGDGQNDVWQIQGASASTISAEPISIFDRFGKILATINPQSSGWDGNYNGNPMPSSDYWFNVTLLDGRRFSSHFTLKR